MVKLYHYTDEPGKNAIESSGIILQSKQSGLRDDAAYGDGVYLTSLGPTNSTDVLLGNNYDGMVVNKAYIPRTKYYFEFDSDTDPAFTEVGKGTNRDVWLLSGKSLWIRGQQAKLRPGFYTGMKANRDREEDALQERYRLRSTGRMTRSSAPVRAAIQRPAEPHQSISQRFRSMNFSFLIIMCAIFLAVFLAFGYRDM